jgi:hypothetical protein
MVTKSQYDIIIKKYDGNLVLIFELARLIERNYSELFHSVIVHGSVATNEVIPYSDFDGLLIVRDDFVTSKRLQKFKSESMRIIYKFDPLQHHGWFQITESDLDNYPESYLPVSTLKYSKLIYPIVDSLNLNLKVSFTIDYKISLEGILNQFEARIQTQWKPSNVYELKSILSQIMLIPCLYYSAINNKGIFKRESFEAVKTHFTEQEWEPIDTASQIRKNWSNEFSAFHSFLLKQSHPLLRKIVKKYSAPRINSKTKEKLNSEFYENLSKLIQKIKIEIQ